jgi:hypothetical protein
VTKRHNDKGRLQPFVPLLKETLDSPAWKAMSHGARSLYVALKRRYNREFHNNGRLYLAQRKAAQEIGSDQKQVARWFRELRHYGFIAMTDPGCLGVEGKGQAPYWRLTELGYMKEPPTRDFMRWNGERFVESKKQNPAGESTRRVTVKSPSGMRVKSPSINGTSAGESTLKGNGQGEGESTLKSSIPLQAAEGGRQDRTAPHFKLVWSTPTLTEIEYTDDLRCLYQQEEERALRERAKRLGYRLKRRGTEYKLTNSDGGFGGTDIDAINSWLDVIEHKLPMQISTACSRPLFTINADNESTEAERHAS